MTAERRTGSKFCSKIAKSFYFVVVLQRKNKGNEYRIEGFNKGKVMCYIL